MPSSSVLLPCMKSSSIYEDFSHHALTSIPPSVLRNAAHLEELDLSDNFLSRLPLSLFCLQRWDFLENLDFHSLRLGILDLSNNFLTELPQDIQNLSELVQLRLRGNQLTSLSPALGCLHQLEVFKSGHCCWWFFFFCWWIWIFSGVGRQQQSHSFHFGRCIFSTSCPTQSKPQLLPPWKSSEQPRMLQLPRHTRDSR